MSAASSAEAPPFTTIEAEVARYLRTGDSNQWLNVWSGDDLFARARCADSLLREALIGEVARRAPAAVAPVALAAVDPQRFARRKVEPMVRGLFPKAEQEVLLDVLAQSVVFLTPDAITDVLRTTPWLSTAWNLANLYLQSARAETLSDQWPDGRAASAPRRRLRKSLRSLFLKIATGFPSAAFTCLPRGSR